METGWLLALPLEELGLSSCSKLDMRLESTPDGMGSNSKPGIAAGLARVGAIIEVVRTIETAMPKAVCIANLFHRGLRIAIAFL